MSRRYATAMIRATKVSSGASTSPEYEPPRNLAPRQDVAYQCGNGHELVLPYAAGVEPPWAVDCRRCGQPARRDGAPPNAVPGWDGYKSSTGCHGKGGSTADVSEMAQLRRKGRSEADAEELLAWALARRDGAP
jgi:hypothetical protein